MRAIVILVGRSLAIVPRRLLNFRDLFSAHADVAAEAGAQRAPAGAAGADHDAAAKGVTAEPRDRRLRRQRLGGLRAVRAGGRRRASCRIDSASVAEAMWPEIAELKGTHWHDTLMARRVGVRPTRCDSVYNGDRRPRASSTSCSASRPTPTPERAGRGAEEGGGARWPSSRQGADFGQLAVAALARIRAARRDSGYLPPSPRGRFVPAVRQRGLGAGAGRR